jgi:hypothetical protein
METKKPSLSWINLFLMTLLAIYLYMFNEWLFTVTKPSFMNDLRFSEQLQIFFTITALLASGCLLILLPLVILSLLPPVKRYTAALIKIGGLLPAVIFAALILMLVDNFTYTVFKFGIVTSEAWSRALYGLGFILAIGLCYLRTLNSIVIMSRRNRIWGIAPKRFFRVLTCVLLLSIVVLALPNQLATSALSFTRTERAELRPNILLITSDGVDAMHMSAYGYIRDTTPHIQELAESSLFAENAFPNSAKSSGSVISMYTGKYPAETGLLLPPDVLTGEDSYEHLPGILRAQGYRTVQITSPCYLDANSLGLLEGFDEVKTSGTQHSKYLDGFSKVMPRYNAFFIDDTFNRIVDRIRHIFFVEKMINPYLLVTGKSEPLLDTDRMEMLKAEIRTTNQPLFVHVHLMVTHGPKYKPIEQKYSTGQWMEAQGLWKDDFYDDSILEFDKDIGEVVDYLTDLDLLDNTVLIIGSDHSQKWDPLRRVPLIIHFPHGQYAGKIRSNVQNLDIAPTILDYIGLDQPGWMRGTSLIAGELEQRSILGMSAIDPEDLEEDSSNTSNEEIGTSASDDLYFNTLIYCQKWFKLDSYLMSWTSGVVKGSTAACPPDSEITDRQAFQQITEHLQENGFDVSALNQLSP